jgi:hypothetical protein
VQHLEVSAARKRAERGALAAEVGDARDQLELRTRGGHVPGTLGDKRQIAGARLRGEGDREGPGQGLPLDLP